jgi:hypothetical protein
MNHSLLTILSLTLLVSACGDVSKGRPTDVANVFTPTLTGNTHLVASQIHRTRNLPVLTFEQEIALVTSTLTAGYRAIPDMVIDDEGKVGVNIDTQTHMGRPTIACGVETTFTNITNRILDCASKEPSRSIWNGTLNGSSGESNWNLVYNSPTTPTELWLDTRINMVWSNVMTAKNWCMASGNIQNQTAGTALTIDCETLGATTSVCTNLNVAGVGNQIKWRLPTRNDYLQADLDGIRFVLDNSTSHSLWTSTLQAADPARAKAWLYSDKDGTLSADMIENSHVFRCIGSPVL